MSEDKDFIEMDYKEHNKTYDGFIKVTKYTTIFVILVLVFLVTFVY
jgi:hypothetical protein